LVAPHALYQDLGRDPQERQAAYQALFRDPLDEGALAAIREATNKAWLLGNDRFREAIEQKLNRRAVPSPRGGDRRSRSYRERVG
jgi:putative transposase